MAKVSTVFVLGKIILAVMLSAVLDLRDIVIKGTAWSQAVVYN